MFAATDIACNITLISGNEKGSGNVDQLDFMNPWKI